jgi:hypothetical protein
MMITQATPQLVLFPAQNAAELTRWGAAAANFGNAFSRVRFGRDPDTRDLPHFEKVVLVNPQAWGEAMLGGLYDHLSARAPGTAVETVYVTGPAHLAEVLNRRAYTNDRSGQLELAQAQAAWQAGGSLIGLYGRGSGEFEQPDFDIVRTARIEAVKLIAHHNAPTVNGLHAVNPGLFYIFRPTVSFDHRRITPADFVRFIEGDLDRAIHGYGISYIEVHNEPNIGEFGAYGSWANGREFGDWFVETLALLRARWPTGKWGFPGVSPGYGFEFPPKRLEAIQFLTESAFAAEQADWIGVHNYWTSRNGMMHGADGWFWTWYKRRFPRKLLMITEFGNPAQAPAEVADQYARYYSLLRQEPWMAAAFAYIVSNNAPGDPGNAGWVWRTEDGQDRGLAAIVGERRYLPGGAPARPPAATLQPGQPAPAPLAPPGPTPVPACQDPNEFWDPFLNRCRLPNI